jgi:hypothetical protein
MHREHRRLTGIVDDDDGVPTAQDYCPTTPGDQRIRTATASARRARTVTSSAATAARRRAYSARRPPCRFVSPPRRQLDVNSRTRAKRRSSSMKKVAAATTVADFGDPLAGSTVAVICLYANGRALAGATSSIAAANSVSGSPSASGPRSQVTRDTDRRYQARKK